MINLESIKEILDSKGYDENKTTLLDFIIDAKFKYKFNLIKTEIDACENCSSAEYEDKFKS